MRPTASLCRWSLPQMVMDQPHTPRACFMWRSLATKFWHELIKGNPPVVVGCVVVVTCGEPGSMNVDLLSSSKSRCCASHPHPLSWHQDRSSLVPVLFPHPTALFSDCPLWKGCRLILKQNFPGPGWFLRFSLQRMNKKS